METPNNCNGSICSSEHCPCSDKLDWSEKDEKSLNPPPLCPLSRMFELQKEFNKRVGLDTDSLNASCDNPAKLHKQDNDKQKWIDRLCTAMTQEIAELRDSVQWKWWKQQDFDKQNARVEVIDLFHFLISTAQVLGMTPEDVLLAYEKKNQVNHKRQNNGELIGGERNPDDSKHI